MTDLSLGLAQVINQDGNLALALLFGRGFRVQGGLGQPQLLILLCQSAGKKIIRGTGQRA